MALPLVNNFEGGTNGTTISAANSGGASGDAFDLTLGTAVPYSNTHAAHGVLGMSPATTAQSMLQWTTSLGSPTEMWVRVYLYLTGNFSSSCPFIYARDQTNATNICGARIITGGTTPAISANGFTAATNLTNAVPLNTWVRFELHCLISGGNATADVQYYDALDSLTAKETATTGAIATAATSFGAVRFGANLAQTAAFWMDAFAVSGVGYPGPFFVSLYIPQPVIPRLRTPHSSRTGPPILLTQQIDLPTVQITTVNVTDTATGTDVSRLLIQQDQFQWTTRHPRLRPWLTAGPPILLTQQQVQPVYLIRSDAAAGSDVSALTATLLRPDSTTGSDASTLTATFARVDSAAGSDASTLKVTLARTDSGAGTDLSNLAFLPDSAFFPLRHPRLRPWFRQGPPILLTQYQPVFAGVVSLFRTDSGAGTDASTLIATYARTDSGAGTDVSTLKANFTRVDAGTGSDGSAITANYPRTDAGAGSDASSLTATLLRTDAATGTDVSRLSFLPDAAFYPLRHPRLKPWLRQGPPILLVQAQVQPVYLIRSDSGAASDASALTATFALVDSATGTDFSRLLAAYDPAFFPLRHPRLRPWTRSQGPPILLTQAQPVTAGTTLVFVNDSGAGTDVSTLKVNLPRTDSGTGSDVSLLTASFVRAESGAGSDVSHLTANYARTDAGAGTDASILKVNLPRADSGTGSDSSILKAKFTRPESGTGSDVSHMSASYPRTDSATGTDFVAGRSLTRQDGATGADVSHLTAKYTRPDSATGTDVITSLTARLNRVESGFGTDVSHLTIFIADHAFFKLDVNDVLKFKLDVTPSITLSSVAGFARIITSVTTKANFILNVQKV